MHYLDFSPDVFIILLTKELPFGDSLAGIVVTGGFVGTEIGGAELTLTQFLAEGVDVSQELGLVRENPCGGFLIRVRWWC